MKKHGNSCFWDKMRTTQNGVQSMKKLMWLTGIAALGIATLWASSNGIKEVITGKDSFVNAKELKSGSFRRITVGDLPEPTKGTPNFGRPVARPEGVMPVAPAGFTVTLYAHDGLKAPRQIRRAPNGDFVVAESNSGNIDILHDNNGKPEISV